MTTTGEYRTKESELFENLQFRFSFQISVCQAIWFSLCDICILVKKKIQKEEFFLNDQS